MPLDLDLALDLLPYIFSPFFFPLLHDLNLDLDLLLGLFSPFLFPSLATGPSEGGSRSVKRIRHTQGSRVQILALP